MREMVKFFGALEYVKHERQYVLKAESDQKKFPCLAIHSAKPFRCKILSSAHYESFSAEVKRRKRVFGISPVSVIVALA